MTETGAIVRHVVVEGYVQGVGYREFTRRAALRLSVAGWVRNRSDGAVEALITEMRKGPRSAVVDRLSVIEHDEIAGGDSGMFVIR